MRMIALRQYLMPSRTHVNFVASVSGINGAVFVGKVALEGCCTQNYAL